MKNEMWNFGDGYLKSLVKVLAIAISILYWSSAFSDDYKCLGCEQVTQLSINSISPKSNGSIKFECVKRDFEEFLLEFSENKYFQEYFTKFPLHKLIVKVDALPEPKPEELTLEKESVVFPIFPNAEKRKTANLRLKITSVKSKVKVTLNKDDTDYLVSYFFVQDHCWYLVRIEDWSL